VMNHGVIEQVGTPAEIYRDPETLFVADFIGEMNQIEGEVLAANIVRMGNIELACKSYDFAKGERAIVTIRPEDIIPHGEGARSPGGEDSISEPGNMFDVTIASMEFLGSFWRAELASNELGDAHLNSNFSINAVRRMGLEVGKKLQVELPFERLKIFARAS
jgi:iron(III) transport system ATP-binding protein